MKKKWLFVLTLAGLGLLLLVFEFAARATRPHIVQVDKAQQFGLIIDNHPGFMIRQTSRGRRLIPSAHVRIMNHLTSHRSIEVRTNSLGFRGREIQIPKPPGIHRILVLGDSIALSASLPEEETFVHHLELLANRHQKGMHVEVLNAGVDDIGIKEEIDILDETVARVTPNLVLICFYLNDSRPPWGFTNELNYAGWWRRHSVLYDQMYRQFVLRAWLHRQGTDRFAWIPLSNTIPWKTDRSAFHRLTKSAQFDWGAAWQSDGWEIIDSQMQRLASIAKTHRFRVGVVVFPVRFQVETNFVEALPQWAMEKLTKEKGFAYLDLLPLLRSYTGEKPLFFDQCHLTPEGQILIAQALAPFVETIM